MPRSSSSPSTAESGERVSGGDRDPSFPQRRVKLFGRDRFNGADDSCASDQGGDEGIERVVRTEEELAPFGTDAQPRYGSHERRDECCAHLGALRFLVALTDEAPPAKRGGWIH